MYFRELNMWFGAFPMRQVRRGVYRYARRRPRLPSIAIGSGCCLSRSTTVEQIRRIRAYRRSQWPEFTLSTNDHLRMKPTKSMASSFQFVHKGILLDYRAAQTKSAISRLRANYHLFLKNQPKKPEPSRRHLNLRPWKAPVVKY